MQETSIHDCRLINLLQIKDRRGNITPINNGKELPFNVQRVFYIYDIPGGEDRGAHAHKECQQFLVAVSGSFEVEVDDGCQQNVFLLNRPYYGLYIPPGIWAAEKRFSGGAICLALTSSKYDADDYIRNYDQFKSVKILLKDS